MYILIIIISKLREVFKKVLKKKLIKLSEILLNRISIMHSLKSTFGIVSLDKLFLALIRVNIIIRDVICSLV